MNLDDFPFEELTEELVVGKIYSVSEFIEICKVKDGLNMEESLKILKLLLDLKMINSLEHFGEAGYSQFRFNGTTH